VKAVSPPNRSVRCCRTAAYFSGANGRPLLSLRVEVFQSDASRRPASKPKHSEHEKQRDGAAGRQKQRPKAAKPVREKEKHNFSAEAMSFNN